MFKIIKNEFKVHKIGEDEYHFISTDIRSTNKKGVLEVIENLKLQQETYENFVADKNSDLTQFNKENFIKGLNDVTSQINALKQALGDN